MRIDGLNSVYEKKAGTGAAYVLPQNQAIGIFASGLADQRERQRLLDAANLKRQQELQDENSKTIGSLKVADHWGERAAEIQKDYDSLTEYALKATQNNQNLNTDKTFLQMKNGLMSKAAATKDLQHLYEQNFNEVSKNPDAYENGIDVLKSFRGASIDDFKSGKFKPDTLKRIYSLADAIKESDGTISYVKNNDGTFDTTRVDRSNNVGQALTSLSTTPAKYLIEKAGGDTGQYISGFPTVTKEGKTYFNTQGDDFEDAVIQRLATDPNLPTYLQSKGYDVSSTDSIRKAALDFAAKQNKATGSYVKDYADTLENKGTTDSTRVFAAEVNRRANRSAQIAEERLAHDKMKWADEELAKNPDAIVPNVKTNIASTQTDGKVIQRVSTSYAATNVGNAKSSFLPSTIFDPETGLSKQNAGSVNISGGQVHIKPVLRFNGIEKILDDKSLNEVKQGNYKINGKSVPKNAMISYDELLYGDERIPADPNDMMSKATIRKLVIPVTGQSLDKKFDKAYNRVSMWNSAIKSMPDDDDRRRAAYQVVKQYNEGKGYSEDQLKAQAAAYLNSIK